MEKTVVVPTERLNREPYSSILCFPNSSETELESRLQELRNHDIDALEFSGKASLYRVPVPVLGKGFVGIVVIAHMDNKRVAVKIRRADADRADLLHEASMLSKANSVHVAPKLIGASKNFLLMQLIDGDLFPDWLETNKDASLVRRVLGGILEQCFRLDQIGLDHGELSKAPKHIIIDQSRNPWIVDFETASDTRKPANLSAICHFLFSSAGEVARTIARIINERDQLEIIRALQVYKKARTRENFEKVLSFCLG